MGMMIFLMASGLSLVFGLMDVLNFGHSAFVSFGAFIAATRSGRARRLGAWCRARCSTYAALLPPSRGHRLRRARRLVLRARS
jgi:branched-subunit amino acid ABC-type transport system permease component